MTTRVLIERVEGNIGPDIVVTVDETDLTGVSSITAIVRYENGQSLQKACIISDAVNGVFYVDWAAGDLIEGDHELEFRFVSGANITTVPPGLPYILRVRQRV